MLCFKLPLSIVAYCSGTCLYGRELMLMAFESNTFILSPAHPRFGPAIALLSQYIRCLCTFMFLSLNFAFSPAFAISIPPPRSAIASAVPAPGGTSYKTGVQEKTSLSTARYSLALIRLPALLMLTQISARPHLMHGLVLLAWTVWVGYHSQWVRPSL